MGAVHLLLGCAPAAGPTRAAAAIEVSEAVEPSRRPSPPRASAPTTRKTFDAFLEDFLTHVAVSERPVVDRGLGVLVATNAGGFPVLGHFRSYGDLLASERVPARLIAAQAACGEGPWASTQGSVPTYSCETRGYDVSDPCVRGVTRGPRFGDLAMDLTGPVLSEEYGAELERVARGVELHVTHFAFIASQHLFLYFGQVDGNWKLLEIDAEEPCD